MKAKVTKERINYLADKYEVCKSDVLLARTVRFLRGSNRCPNFIYEKSLKKYGYKDNLARFWSELYRGVPIGKYAWGYRFVEGDMIKSVGAFCSIAINQLLVPSTHRMDYVSSWDSMIEYENPEPIAKSVEIGNDVWIGANSTILNNVKIGDGAVIGAGSIIRKDVPPYAVVVGCDRIVKYRFSQDIINALLEMHWWDWDDEKLKESFAYFNNPIAFIERYKNEKNY